MRFVVAALALWLASLAPPADGLPGRAACEASWSAADIDGDGVLVDREATPYLAMMILHKVALPEDGRIEGSRFIAACLAGAFRTGYIVR